MRPGAVVDAPVTNSGLELHATLIAREIGEQLIARTGAPTVVATYRLANERPEPPGGVPSGQGTLLNQMLDQPDRTAEIWGSAAENGVKAAESTAVLDATTANALRAFIVDIRKDLSAWSIAFNNIAAEGPAKIHSVAGETTLHLRLLDKLLAGTKVQAPAAMRLRTAIDTVHGKLRVDAVAAVQRLLTG